jgi:hypothetical protein
MQPFYSRGKWRPGSLCMGPASLTPWLLALSTSWCSLWLKHDSKSWSLGALSVQKVTGELDDSACMNYAWWMVMESG